jgi:hypothetical protein
VRVVLQVLLGLLCVLTGLVTAAFSFLWWNRYNMPFNSEGRWYDGEVVYHESAVFVYGLLAIGSAALTMGLAWLLSMHLRSK